MTLTINAPTGTVPSKSETVSPGTFAIGVNLAGMEYGKPGAVQNKNYVVPSLSELEYYKSQGTDLIRLPISWETLQTTLNGSLTESYVANIKTVLADAASLGMNVVIDLHNFGAYDGVKIGVGEVTDSAFANLWKQLSAAVQGSAGLAGYDLMNEPSNMPSATAWTSAAQAAVTAIRGEDKTSAIYVEGNDYANAANWSSLNPGLQNLVDPSHNLVFEAHVYLDSNDSGTNFDWAQQAALGSTVQTGADRLENFVSWLKEYNLKGAVGEVGVGNDNSAWLVGLDDTLAYAKANNLQTTYWAGGAWWGSYPMSVEPQNGVAAAQMAVLDKYSGVYPAVSSATLSGKTADSAYVYFSENDVLVGTAKSDRYGDWKVTLKGLANGVHTIVVGTTKPGVDGTIAAVTFNLEATTPVTNVIATISPATVASAPNASMTYLAPAATPAATPTVTTGSTAWKLLNAEYSLSAGFVDEPKGTMNYAIASAASSGDIAGFSNLSLTDLGALASTAHLTHSLINRT